MKSILIHYVIRINEQTPITLAIKLEELEQQGIECWLQHNTTIRPSDKVHVLSRYVYANPARLLKFRVFLKSISYFINTEYPEYKDVMAISKGKAIIEALQSSGIYNFPDGWRDIKVERISG
ncbi:MAG: hypothetical protein MUF42_12115 [Cytophagaceae bacterium]|jgi:hypothetical protein|nr:hypothetical protein [Cytophagaceae bacterium]